jgi:hypothetical protein
MQFFPIFQYQQESTMNTPVQQNYVMVQGKYLDGTSGVEMVTGSFDSLKVGDDFRIYHGSSTWLTMGNDPTRYLRTDCAKPWTVIKLFNQEEQAILRAIENRYSFEAIENLFASNVAKKITPVYSAS